MAEFIGGLETSLPRLREAMGKTYQIAFGRSPTQIESDMAAGKMDQVLAIFKHLATSGKIVTTLLPQLHIQATIFAKVLSEDKREVARSDFDDVWHATDALPSCQMFFTEHYFGHLLTHPPSNLADVYKTIVVSRLQDAVAELRKIT